jgi:hypothetical protein
VKGRARGCLIAAAVALALVTTVVGVVGPGLFRTAREVYAPVQKMRSAQQDFEAWSKQQEWHEPATPSVSEGQLDRFLALRKELQHLEEDAPRPRRERGEPRPRFQDMPKIVSGVSGFVSARLEAFKRVGMTNAEYRYLDHLVYGRWLEALRGAGQDPAVLEQVEQEILNAARDEADAATAKHLRAAAQKVKQRKPGPPAGVPENVHALLLSKVNEIEALSDSSPRRLTTAGP